MQPPSVTRMKLASLQVCAPASFTDEEVEEFANRERPTGIDSRWTIRRTGDPALNGDPERNPCADDPENVHIMLDC